MADSKVCSICGVEKPADEFRRRTSRQCKVCYRAKEKARRATPYAKAVDRASRVAYEQKPHIRAKALARERRRYANSAACRLKNHDRGAAFRRSERGRIYMREAAARKRAKYPEKTAARLAVSRAIAAGRMPHVKSLSCASCGNPACEYHHHNGYSEAHWLDVVPLCRPCHVKAG